MTCVIFVHPSGAEHVRNVANGQTLMQAAVAAGVDGIIGECGGSALCATCHVYINEGQIDRLPSLDLMEDELLNCTAAERRSNSRLSCQLLVSDKFEGLIIHIPERQIP
ncbi:(2Fe-2S)-binding protein [Bradyrhizobium sp. KBS0727]|uniref:2Fe-2S iron-sulfur cluster-binding protein n=1 Tax=unclassified Bradyrhizobium TaxID=2631580 RepID=UPI00110D4642|nr:MULTISPECIES: 2Fe-2S iron-sulfur cluster-binding protein [unclassified Bradyrhizobium]QDW40582.1 (2Fe-2S)-binding protein [Bradyrhizobium sp. KBS0725]QDW47187.1 (2Fe-2S)-binding protein [Bradyrhizobium sp. KBS0727]